MEYNDIQDEIMYHLSTDDQALLRLCSTNKSMHSKCSTKNYWANVFSRYQLPLPHANFTSPEEWILSFTTAFKISLFVDKLINYLDEHEIIINAGNNRTDIIPYDIFYVKNFDNKKIYIALQTLNFNRLTQNSYKIRVPKFSMLYKNNKYMLHVKYYHFGTNNMSHEEDYDLSEDTIYELLYNFVYNGFVPTSAPDMDGNYNNLYTIL